MGHSLQASLVGGSRSLKAVLHALPPPLAFGNPALGKQTVARGKTVLMDGKLDACPKPKGMSTS
jgi:hypothetical protein